MDLQLLSVVVGLYVSMFDIQGWFLYHWFVSIFLSPFQNRQRPQRRLSWGCNAKVANICRNTQSRLFTDKSLLCSCISITIKKNIHCSWCCAEVQAFWDWRRQERKRNISFLDCLWSRIWSLSSVLSLFGYFVILKVVQ